MNVGHGLIQASTAFDILCAPRDKIFSSLTLFLRLIAHVWVLSWVESLQMHLPDQLANLRLTLDDLVLGLLVPQGELLQLGSCHDWMLSTELGSYSH